MNCIIVDDEYISREILGKLIERVGGLDLIGSCDSARSANRFMQEHKVDLIFLDVEMPELSGLDLLAMLDEKPMIIFVTSKEEYAVRAFDFEAVDYLLKPVQKDRFKRAVEKALDLFESRQSVQSGMTHLFVKKDGNLVRIRLSNILFVEAAADYMIIHTATERFIVHTTMKNLLERLPEDQFARVHRTYTVRLDKIESIEDQMVVVGGKSIAIGGTYKRDFLQSLNRL
jgi:DNA-binding LytR/AlgR family response regulator